jgi:S1-C subfamily serine protease
MAGAAGAGIGSFSMMLYAGSHYPAEASTEKTAQPFAEQVNGRSDQDLIVAAVRRDEPSVVALNVDVNGQEYVPAHPVARFFGNGDGAGAGHMSPFRERASGSGFVYSKDGLIVTNAHVVRFGKGSSVKITVLFANGDKMPAHVYAADPSADLALVKVDNYAKLPAPLELSRSGDVQAGQWAIAIGEPFALQHSVSVGVVSGFDRTETIGSDGSAGGQTFTGLLQTSAPINPGNSGGPLVDENGRVIGVNQSVASPQGGAQGIGFAIPVDTVKQQVALLEQHPGQLDGPPIAYVGIAMKPVDSAVRTQLGYRGNGVAVEGVYQGGPADRAGLQQGDVIERIDGKNVTTDAQVAAAVRATKPGQLMRMQFWSAGFKKLAVLTVGTAPDGYQVGAALQPSNPQP